MCTDYWMKLKLVKANKEKNKNIIRRICEVIMYVLNINTSFSAPVISHFSELVSVMVNKNDYHVESTQR